MPRDRRARGGRAPRSPHHAARPQIEPRVIEGGARASALCSRRPAPRYGSGSHLRYSCFSCLLARVGPPSRVSSARAIAVPVQWGTHHCCEAFFFISLRRGVLCHRRILGTFAPFVWSFRAFRGFPAVRFSRSCAGIVRRAGGHAPGRGSGYAGHIGRLRRVSFGCRGV